MKSIRKITKLFVGTAALLLMAQWAKAQSGKALVLNGSSQYMTVPHSNLFNFDGNGTKGNTALTITFWFKTSAGGANARVIAKRANAFGVDQATGGVGGTGYEAFLNSGNSGQLGPNLRTTASTPNLGAAYNSKTGIYDNVWHHAAFIVAYDGANTINATYIDGANYTSKSTTGVYNAANLVNLVIGAASDFSNKYAGLLDDIRIYNKELTASEVANDLSTLTVDNSTPNLVAAWDFENVSGANVPDVSGNGHDGTLVGSPALKNVFSKYLLLNGTDAYMVVSNHADLNLAAGQSLTITAKVRTNDFSKRILSKRPGGAGVGYEFINNSSGNGQFGINLTTNKGAAGPPYGTSNIADYSWHHLAMVVDPSTSNTKIYVDGVLQQTKNSTNLDMTSTVNNSADLFFGTLNTFSSFMNVQLDDIRFWRMAMTDAEVLADKDSTIDGSEANLIAAWDFENVSGNTVPDISGNNHPGTLNGGYAIITPTGSMQVVSTSLTQTQLPTGKGNANQRIIAVQVKTEGTQNPLTLSQINFNMNGTTNINDVSSIKIYYTGANSRFDTSNLFATVTPASGTLTANGSQSLTMGDNYFFISYDVSASATEGNLLDAACESIVTNAGTTTLSSSTVSGSRTILLAHSLLFKPGDYGSVSYRIPAIVTAADGSLVTVTDKRWNHSGDLAAKIDPVVRRSTDGGKTWSEPVVIANFGGPNGAGDAALVVDKTNNDIICLVSADKGLWSSTHADPAKVLIIRSSDNGVTWGAPVDVTSQIYGPNPGWKALFVASGRANQLRDGTLVAAITVREDVEGVEKLNNYMIKSTDHGVTWIATAGMAELGGDESKIVELNNGDLMMSIRNPGTRRFNTSSDKGLTWGTAYNQPAITDPNCNGDFIRYTSTIDGYDKNRLLHSIPFAGSRQNVSVMMSTDEGATWPIRKTIFPASSAYSSLTILPDGTIGMYYENGEYGDVYGMYFVNFSLSWLTDGADTYVPSPLPVKLEDFGAKAEKIGNRVNAYWKTSSEQSLSHFVLECSEDGQNFVKVAQSQAKSSMGVQTYSTYFNSPFKASKIYLRLKSVDKDGSSEYSNTIALNLNLLTSFLLSPNPAKDQVQVSTGPIKSGAELSFVNTLGKTVKRLRLEQENPTISLKDLPKGLYVVKLKIDEQELLQKLIKE